MSTCLRDRTAPAGPWSVDTSVTAAPTAGARA